MPQARQIHKIISCRQSGESGIIFAFDRRSQQNSKREVEEVSMFSISKITRVFLSVAALLLIPSATALAMSGPAGAVFGAASPASAGQVVQVRNIPGLGNVLVGSDGMTLYVFTKDPPGANVCTGACASLWPAEQLEPGQVPSAGSGVTAAVGSIILADESSQITINNMPVFNYSKDLKPGDVLGQGFKGFWYVLDPSGKLIKTSAPGFDVQIRNVPGLGNILVGEDGMTLYVFTKNPAGVNTCNGACATLWPAELLEPGQVPSVASGVTATVGTIILADESAQITINKMPVYNYSKDQKPGDVLGQGFKGFWYVLDPSGKLIKTAPPA
jgi:predicted lipoprotein with Yx(FWY)xxD motif